MGDNTKIILASTVAEGLETPWKVGNQIVSWMTFPLARMLFAQKGIVWGKGWRFFGLPIIQKYRHSKMCFGDGLQLRSTVRSNPLGLNHPVFLCTLQADAVIETGINFGMSGGVICAAESVSIGNNVILGANSMIMDTDFHPGSFHLRKQNPNLGNSSPVTIEDGVFIGSNCIILKGVTLGKSCLVGTGSVVTRDVQAGTVVFGNPARVIGKVYE